MLDTSNIVKSLKPSATLGMAQAAKKLKDEGVDVVVLSAGEPDFPTPKSICDVAQRSIQEGKTHYVPVKGTDRMVEAMQQKFLRDQKVEYGKDEVICTVGAKSAVLLALQAIVNKGDEVILFSPYWVSYKAHVNMVEGTVVEVQCGPENNFMPTAEQLKSAISNKTKAILLNSPNNPSGAVITQKNLQELGEVLHGSNIWVISDEIYEKLLFDGSKHFSPAALSSDMRDRTIVISGASKGYAMTGWRVGVVAGNKQVIAPMTKLLGQQTTCLPEFIQDAASFALLENEVVRQEIEKMVNAYDERRKLCVEKLKVLKEIKFNLPKGAFYIWADFSAYFSRTKSQNDIEFATKMLEEAHVACVPGTPFGAPGFIRISIASSKKDIETAIERLEKWLEK